MHETHPELLFFPRQVVQSMKHNFLFDVDGAELRVCVHPKRYKARRIQKIDNKLCVFTTFENWEIVNHRQAKVECKSSHLCLIPLIRMVTVYNSL